MMRGAEIPLGVLFSGIGAYAPIGRAAVEGALIAIEEVNASDLFDFRFRAVVADPAGKADQYAVLARQMMAEGGCRHIIGCQTPSSRKEVLPVLERHQGLLWYATPYEGFESHERVIYTGACPNQNIVRLFAAILPGFGKRAFLAGSNYIWGWEMNRIAREILVAREGSVLGERYVAVGNVEIEHLVAEIAQLRPDFVFNNLIGDSSYAFLRALHELAAVDPTFRPEVMPVLSCNLTEAELSSIGTAAAGVISPRRAISRRWIVRRTASSLRGCERGAPESDGLALAFRPCSRGPIRPSERWRRRSRRADPSRWKRCAIFCPIWNSPPLSRRPPSIDRPSTRR
ncbi:transporter substrate-binding protein [Breoghania sp.]|uniref:transporter substrate-binding protein n=1 Tax=Breoghania sp. TaxID=2065378 RepID=UPI00262892A7|nr:transporter substrate-binding protein [Breoghania sp.]MDJ0933055.1 transporter substrate-binding protein [Breoghania sp.]